MDSPPFTAMDCYDTSVYHGKPIDDVIHILREGVTGNVVAANLFYIADDQTIRDHTLLLVQVQDQENDIYVFSVRLAPELRMELRHRYMILNPTSIQDIQKDVDKDGVYRGRRDTQYSYVGTLSHYLNYPDISGHW
jgi:hypothetical protein